MSMNARPAVDGHVNRYAPTLKALSDAPVMLDILWQLIIWTVMVTKC